MRIHVPLLLLAVAGTAQASDTVGFGHRVVSDDGQAAKPMAWRYGMLQMARDVFDEGAPRQAPGATLSFVLPKVDAAGGDNKVELVQGNSRTALPMASATAFTLAAEPDVAGDAEVVANRSFTPGEVNHPNVRVRSPGLPDGVQRMGDLRLACAAQMAMAKTEGFKLRLVLGAASLFGGGVCGVMEVTKFDPPTVPYDTVTIEDGGRRLVQRRTQAGMPKLGDEGWSDDARISYTVETQAAR